MGIKDSDPQKSSFYKNKEDKKAQNEQLKDKN